MIELPLLESLDVQTEIEFNNIVLQNGAGQIQAIIQWQDALRTFNLSRQILYPPQRQALVDFFLSVKASGEAFLYRDKSDFQCRYLTTPYGSSNYGALYPIAGNDYQICKAYSIGDSTYLRPISHPVNIIVYNGGVEQTGWVLGDNGRITIPTAFDEIEFDFFVPVRFQDEDLSSAITATYGDNSRILYSLSKLVLKEVKILFDISPVDTFTVSSTHVLTLDLLKGQYIERVQEKVTGQGSGFEFIERQESESIIELQQRKILRKPEMDYLIALWLCVKGDGGAFGFLKFDSSIIATRFVTKALSYQFEAYFGDNEAVFNLGGIAIAETLPPPTPPPLGELELIFDSGTYPNQPLTNFTITLDDLSLAGSQGGGNEILAAGVPSNAQIYLISGIWFAGSGSIGSYTALPNTLPDQDVSYNFQVAGLMDLDPGVEILVGSGRSISGTHTNPLNSTNDGRWYAALRWVWQI